MLPSSIPLETLASGRDASLGPEAPFHTVLSGYWIHVSRVKLGEIKARIA